MSDALDCAALVASVEGRPDEPALDPDLPIVDAHHHLWAVSVAYREGRRAGDPGLSGFERQSLRAPRYLLEDLLRDADTGHRVVSTVYAQARAMYRRDTSPALAPVGETEFANGVAAMAAGGDYGPTRVCEGIVGFADLLLGDDVAPVLEAHLAAAGARFKGVRHNVAWSPDPSVFGGLTHTPGDVMQDATFRAGLGRLAGYGLSFDTWVLAPQLPELAALARDFPDTTVVLDHLGTPAGIGALSPDRWAEAFSVWRAGIEAVAAVPNVVVKIGGLGMEMLGFDLNPPHPPRSSVELAAVYRPYVFACIEAFGADRCMFESNFPVDRGASAYSTLWNTFTRLTSDASPTERHDLFAGTAQRVYRLTRDPAPGASHPRATETTDA